MEDLATLVKSKRGDLTIHYENSMYSFLSINQRDFGEEPESTSSEKIEVFKQNGKPYLVKSSFTLRALVSAYDLYKRCKLPEETAEESMKRAIIAVGEAILNVPPNTAPLRDETKKRLEDELKEFIPQF